MDRTALASDGTRLSGDGHAMGTRRPEDFDAATGIDLARRQLMRGVPAWVRTFGDSPNAQTNEDAVEQEVYGRLKRSFQTWTDFPAFQWHRWYDWNFHIEPEKPFDWLRGQGNIKVPPPPGTEEKSDNQKKFPMVDAVRGNVMECEWDAGAFGLKPGPMFNDRDKGQVAVDWVWPMTGDFVWLIGRSIYDGGHESGTGKPDDPKLCRSELHPCKAMATARREAFNFVEVGHFVPAVQFSFFSSTLGGVLDFNTLQPKGGKNYEFVVDLPLRPPAFQALLHPIGATPDFPFNRVALRPVEPIVDFDFQRHRNALGKQLTIAQLRADPPVVEFFQPVDDNGKKDPDKWQAKITIPLVELLKKRGAFQTYGVVVSLGWPDPDGAEGRKIKRVQVNFGNLTPHAFAPNNQNWRYKVGVNGRWFHWEQQNVMHPRVIRVGRSTRTLLEPVPIPLTMPQPLVFFLHEEDAVRISAHGAILGPVDGVHTGRTPSGTLGGNILGGFGTDDARTLKLSPVQIAIESGASAIDIFPDEDFKDQNVVKKILTVLESLAFAPLDLVLTLLGLLGLNPRQLAALGTLRPAEWNRDIDIQPVTATGSRAVQRVVVKNLADMMVFTLGDENDPLALIDGNIGTGAADTLAPPSMVGKNPMPVAGRGDGAPQSVTAKGLITESNEALAELLEHVQVDAPPSTNGDPVMYELEYTVAVQDQFPNATS